MIGHLGTRVSALLDGRLSAQDEERAWAHVHACHPCRDSVEREGWVKTHLAQWSTAAPAPSSHGLRESLLACATQPPRYPVEAAPVAVAAGVSQTHRHAVAFGGSVLGVAVMGLVALSAAPANAPQWERRGPTTSIVPASVATNLNGDQRGSGGVPATSATWGLRSGHDKMEP